MYFIIQYDDPVIAGFLIPRSFHCAYSLWWALEFLCWLSLSNRVTFWASSVLLIFDSLGGGGYIYNRR